MLIGICVGTTVGAIAGQVGGVVDNARMRVTDLFLSLPQLPIFLLVVYLFRDSIKRVLGPELGAFVLIVSARSISSRTVGRHRVHAPVRSHRSHRARISRQEGLTAPPVLDHPHPRVIAEDCLELRQ